jgi:hypothetical protein
MDVVLALVHRLKNRRRRQQRNFMFAAATAKENAYAQFFHESGMKVQCTAKTKTSRTPNCFNSSSAGGGIAFVKIEYRRFNATRIHIGKQAKLTEEAAHEASNAGKQPEGF